MLWGGLAVLTAAGLFNLVRATSSEYVQGVRIVKSFPHATDAFTQGLCVGLDGAVYESDGIYGHSRVRLVDLETGDTKTGLKNEHRHFGEGLAFVADTVLLQLTWREKLMFEYDVSAGDIRKLRTLEQPFSGQGWGVAYDAVSGFVYFSDGTAKLHTFRRRVVGDAVSYDRAKPTQFVTDPRLGDLKIEGLNELEMVGRELWANVYPMRHHKASNCVARIDPTTATVTGWVDLNVLLSRQSHRVQARKLDFVLNGIAYDPRGENRSRLFVTGKQWDFLYDVDLVPLPLSKGTPEDHVRRHCSLYFPPDARGGSSSRARRDPS